MKRIIYALIVAVFLSACNKENTPESGDIHGTILYQGARDKQVDGVLVTLQEEGSLQLYRSERTTNTGEYKIQNIPAGKYKLIAIGWGMDTLQQSISIPMNGRHDIDMTQALIKPQIFQNGKPIGSNFDMSETPSLNFDILNGNREVMRWSAETSDDWVSVTPIEGTLLAGEQDYAFTIKINRDKLECNTPPATININSNKGSTTLKLTATKPGCVGKAEIEIIERTDHSTLLKAKAKYANSYKWFFGNEEINNQNGDGYLVTESGIYYVIGVNLQGETGMKSEGVSVEITALAKPGKATISGENKNNCPHEQVTLSAGAKGATYYRWYKNGSEISGEYKNTCVAKSTGLYSVEGRNPQGVGERSNSMEVTIIPCPVTPTISADATTNTCPETKVKLTAYSKNATSYEWHKGSQRLSETSAICFAAESGSYFVFGINDAGKSSQSASKNVTIISCLPGNLANVTAIMSDRGIKLSWNSVSLATGYKIYICDNPQMSGCNRVIDINNSFYINDYDIPGDMLFCGMNYFKVIPVNSVGEGVSAITSLNRVISITAPSLSIHTYGSLSWVYSRVKGASATIYYDIYRKIVGSGSGEWIKIEEMVTNTYYTPSYEAQSGETVYYKIRSYIITECGIFENYSNVEASY